MRCSGIAAEVSCRFKLCSAFSDAHADPAKSSARAALHIRGFAENGLDDYVSTLSLGPFG